MLNEASFITDDLIFLDDLMDDQIFDVTKMRKLGCPSGRLEQSGRQMKLASVHIFLRGPDICPKGAFIHSESFQLSVNFVKIRNIV